VLPQIPGLPAPMIATVMLIERISGWAFILLVLLPLAMTMALIWKTKEVILESVFASKG